MKIVVVINPGAGTVAGIKEMDPAELVKDTFRRHGVDAVVKAVPPDEIGRVVKQAMEDGVDGIAAGGGDGTINSVAAHLADTRTPLGVLPLGTFNHFAKDLGIPVELEAAVEVIVRGKVREVDLGEVNGHIFLNNSSIGAYPQAVDEREKARREQGRRKPVAMVLAVLRVFRLRPLLRVQLSHSGGTHLRLTPFVFIGNNEYGNLLKESKRPRLDGGTLCLFTAKSTGLRCLLRLIWAGIRNRLAESPDFEYQPVHEVKLALRGRKLRVARDGEVFHLPGPLHYRVRPGALRVFAPEPQESAA